eukprot:TRINITY_DN21935_c1_g1_i1.p1 TRINITY_DN21935_c1_g1~~TRINITY_DN21935_c1_g1_i1.p1  ORF type:complete len:592 (+),score=133.77 TRINITY_DN21935_c1_g1_i1:58-1833(+)
MAASQGDRGARLVKGNTRSKARPGKRDKGLCLLCMKSGRKSRLQLFQIGSNEAMYLCSNETCPYPVSMFDDLHSSVVSREITELKVTSPQKTTGERPGTTTYFPTSMPLVVPVEVQKIPTMPKEDVHFKRNSVGDITEDPMNQFKVWMQSKKLSSRSSSLTQESQNVYKNGDLTEKEYSLANKRVRTRNSCADADSKTDTTAQSRLVSHSNRIPSRSDRSFSTHRSIRKIDKTLMEASGVDVDKKFEPFRITPKETLPKPTPEVTDLQSQEITNHEEDPLVDNGEKAIDSQVFHTPIGNNIHDNNHTENNVPESMPSTAPIQNNTDLIQMNSLQVPMLSPEQWQPHTPQPMSMQNGHVTDPLYHSSMLQPQYIHNNYNMMSQYDELLPHTANYHDMTSSVPPSLQSPLSPMPHPSNNYTNEQFYYPEGIYTDYSEQWEDLELTKMLDAIDMPPTEQYDPTLGILPPGTSQPPDLYDVMGPSAMATPVDMPGAYDRPHPSLPIPINSPLISPPISSQPLSNNTHHPVSSQITSPLNGLPQMGITDSVYSVDTNNTANDVTSFNNNPESPMSCYQSPLSQGEYQNLSLVESAT